MSRAWENNPAGICEDAPCCGCCGPSGDGAYDPNEPPDFDDEDFEADYEPETCERCGQREATEDANGRTSSMCDDCQQDTWKPSTN